MSSVIFVNKEHPLKAVKPIVVTPVGIVTEVKLIQFRNELESILVTLSGIIIEVNLR